MIVLDASLFMAWLLSEPDYGPENKLWDDLYTEPAIAPSHWPNEIANALRKADFVEQADIGDFADAAQIGQVLGRAARLRILAGERPLAVDVEKVVAFTEPAGLVLHDTQDRPDVVSAALRP